MEYSDFTIPELQDKFGLKSKLKTLFTNINPLTAGKVLNKLLALAERLPLQSEKAKSELIVMPILLDLLEKNEDYFTIYSGNRLEVDPKAGLIGECDFIIARNTQSYDINLPLLMLVEAKKDNVERGIAQCAAQMWGANLYNKQRKQPVDTIYGCVTTGYSWRFLKLVEKTIFVDTKNYFWTQLPTLLGIFQHIIDEYKEKV